MARPRLRERRGTLAIALAAAAAILLLWRVTRDPGSPAPLARAPSSSAPAHPGASTRTPSENSPDPALAARVPGPGAPTTPEPAAAAPSEVARGAEPARTAEASQGWFETSAPERHAFAHAQVELAAGSRARFDPESRTLELERGRADVDVDPRRGQGFAVLTQHFRVEVLGTQFAVSPDRVEVRRGRVEVFDRAGHVLARELSAGAKFAYAGQPAQQPAARRTGERERERSDDKVRAGERERSDAANLLERAREALAQADVAGARELLQRAERGRLTRGERAELGTLRAECALAAHDAPAAMRAYLEVAQRFGELPAGENAAFAAAQLSARGRDADAASARRLFERYLERYPSGRFAAEARARLRAPAP